MAVLADPIVATLIDEYREAVETLLSTAGNPGIQDHARISIVRQLCELSRDARFHLGPRQYAEPQQLEELAACFEESANGIESLWKDAVPKEVAGYCENIRDRARLCREG